MINDNEDEIAELLGNDHFLLGLSDAGAHTSQLCDANYATYLLQHWWRERRRISLEKAVWRLTGQPAEVYGLTDRGRIAPGLAADVVVFDAATVGTTRARRIDDLPAGADRLVADSTGIAHVWVGGARDPPRRRTADRASAPARSCEEARHDHHRPGRAPRPHTGAAGGALRAVLQLGPLGRRRRARRPQPADSSAPGGGGRAGALRTHRQPGQRRAHRAVGREPFPGSPSHARQRGRPRLERHPRLRGHP